MFMECKCHLPSELSKPPHQRYRLPVLSVSSFQETLDLGPQRELELGPQRVLELGQRELELELGPRRELELG